MKSTPMERALEALDKAIEKARALLSFEQSSSDYGTWLVTYSDKADAGIIALVKFRRTLRRIQREGVKGE